MKRSNSVEDQYKKNLSTMTNLELQKETKDRIWASVFWNQQIHESHEQVSACYAEWISRDGDSSTYKKLHKEVKVEYTR
jgi:hypothetical protein